MTEPGKLEEFPVSWDILTCAWLGISCSLSASLLSDSVQDGTHSEVPVDDGGISFVSSNWELSLQLGSIFLKSSSALLFLLSCLACPLSGCFSPPFWAGPDFTVFFVGTEGEEFERLASVLCRRLRTGSIKKYILMLFIPIKKQHTLKTDYI